MRNTVLAKRYAKALFAVGKEEGESAFDEYCEALNELAKLYVSHPEVKDALTNPMYPLDVRSKVMEHLAKAFQASKVMSNFMNLLVQKKRADVLPDIAEAFKAMVDADRNISQGTVVSATELSDDLKVKVKATLEKLTGKQVVLTSQVDPSVIGGIIARVGDLVLDGSIKSQLAGLKESIKGSE
ncbi:MAG: F0F1 ATP synthase subunit delta [Proteobacteria bacterium]|nr:F0F1 ATP synthase subunit delta [Pseudomonadota bacterium]MBU1709870.1 F0F1 ATP synthase subunit delta [Pseudomonadota bacterium]